MQKIKNDIDLISDEIKNELKLIESNLYALFDSNDHSDELYQKILNMQDDILNNPFFIEHGLSQEFNKLFKILIFLSSKIDTNDKEFKKKMFDILSKFKENKEKSVELSKYYIEYLNELLKLIEDLKKEKEKEKANKDPINYKGINKFLFIVKNLLIYLFNSKPVQVLFSVSLVVAFLYGLKTFDVNFYQEFIELFKTIHKIFL